MEDDRRLDRRRFARLAGLGLAGLAGCAAGGFPSGSDGKADSDGEADSDEPTGDSTATPSDGHEDEDEDEVSHGDRDGGLDGPRESAEVAMETDGDDHHFHPHVVWVEEGGTVTWIPESGSHSTTAYADNDGPRRIPDNAEGWDSGLLGADDEPFEHTFEAAGVYDYFCIPHEAGGMIGSVIVGEPDPDGQPGLAEPGSEFSEGAAEKLRSLNGRVTDALSGSGGDDHHDDGTETKGGYDH